MHSKQDLLLVSIYNVVYTVNKVAIKETPSYNFLWYMKQNLQLPAGIWLLLVWKL